MRALKLCAFGRRCEVAKEAMSRVRMKGLMKSRGIAEVKYQRKGNVPHSEAPLEPGAGKIFDRKAESSGQRSCDGECVCRQK